MFKNPKIILASASQIRLKLLKNAGINVICKPANIDEDLIKKKSLSNNLTSIALAKKLSIMKAEYISKLYPESYIIGCDQTLEYNGEHFDKPNNLDDLRNHLQIFSGQTHFLNAAVSIVKNGKILWHISDHAEMTMWKFNNDFIENYIKIAGNDIYNSVGGYKLEEVGAQLFSAIKGDYFTILGLPLLPLLAFLRENKLLND